MRERFGSAAIVARREMVERGRSPVFRISLVVMVLLIVGGIVAFNYFAGRAEPIEVGLAGTTPATLATDLVAAGVAAGEDVEVQTVPVDAVESVLDDGVVDVVIVDGARVITPETASSTIEFITSTAIRTAALNDLVDSGEVSAGDVAQIAQPVDIVFEPLETPDPDEEARAVVAWIGALLLFTTILMFGQFVAMGIVEEKQNRVVEVVISRIETSQLLVGKVLGIGLLGLLQVGVFVVAGIVTLTFVASDAVPDVDLAAIGVPALLWLVVWFVLGYLLYSFLYAGLGATVSRQEELQGVAFIPAMLLMPAYFLTAVGIGSDVGTIARIASIVPFWSPIVMPLRMTTGTVPPWETALALALIVVTIYATIRFAARVYRGAALRTGGKVKVTEALRSTT
ncbi:MAG: ABC transporter permease [Acidimicrobiia bacterium]|nr:ABC transporter permease [Acidimicrobiia bacterium]